MNLSEKIAQVRLEPEHIRLRYVWGSVAISMIFILAIWIFSIGSLFQGDKNTENKGVDNKPGITEQLQTLKQQAPSIKNLTDQTTGAASEGVDNTKQTSDSQYAAPATDEATPQTNAYSDLPSTTSAQ